MRVHRYGLDHKLMLQSRATALRVVGLIRQDAAGRTCTDCQSLVWADGIGECQHKGHDSLLHPGANLVILRRDAPACAKWERK